MQGVQRGTQARRRVLPLVVATFRPGRPEGERLPEGRMLPRFSRRPALLADVMRKSFKADVYSEGGVYLGTQPAFWYDRARVQRVFESTIRGLYRHEFKERLGASYGVSDFFVNPEIPKAVLAGGEWMPLRVVGGGVFRYRRFRFEEEGIRSGWYLRFFDRLTLLGITGPANELQHGTGWSWPSLAARLHVGRASVRLKAQGGWDVSYPHGQSSEEGTA